MVLNKALEDMLGPPAREPAYEADLGGPREFPASGTLVSESQIPRRISQSASANKKSLKAEKIPAKDGSVPAENGSVSKTSAVFEPPARECAFSEGSVPDHKVLINEVAWMGSEESANDEWIELRNNSGENIQLKNWRLMSRDEELKIVFGEKDELPAGTFALLERGDDGSAPGVKAAKIYSGSISNSKGWLKLFDPRCILSDEANASDGWSKLGGDNKTKRTLERNLPNFNWHTSQAPGGTPGAQNAFMMDESVSYGSPAPAPASPAPAAPAPSEASSSAPEPPPVPEVRVVISEIMAGSDAGSSDEFIELRNDGAEAVELTGWSLKKKTSSGAESSLVSASRLEGKRIPAGKRFLIVNDGGYRGPVEADARWATSNTLAYTNNAIVLYDGNGNKVEEISWAEIPKNQSYARQEDGSFQNGTPTPENSI